MATITAKMVAELRALTGLGMMECKKALVEADGVPEKAEEILRIKSGAKAGKLAGRTAAEGVIAHVINGSIGSIVEVNCETDFVAKDVGFINFAQTVAQTIANHTAADLNELNDTQTQDGQTVEELRKAVIAKLGENMSIRRFQRLETTHSLIAYMHGTKIGVIVEFDGDANIARDVAMHIAAARPQYLTAEEVPAESIEKERRISIERATQENKPENIIPKIAEGAVKKYIADVTLLGQAFVKNPKETVKQLLDSNKTTVYSFTVYQVGEGIEKKVIDYAAEVAAAAKV